MKFKIPDKLIHIYTSTNQKGNLEEFMIPTCNKKRVSGNR